MGFQINLTCYKNRDLKFINQCKCDIFSYKLLIFYRLYYLIFLSISLQIDQEVLAVLDDTALQRFLPKYGDRIAVKEYLATMSTSSNDHPNKKKNLLLSRLRQKLNVTSKLDECNKKSSRKANKKITGNSNALRNTRKIEIGWINFNGITFSQVKSKRGGGTRKVDMLKTSTSGDILQKAKELFFPNGISTLGNEDEFAFTLTDYAERQIENADNLAEMYNQSCMTVLRFYMSTKMKVEDTSANELHKTIDHVDTDELPIFNNNETISLNIDEANSTAIKEVISVIDENSGCSVDINEFLKSQSELLNRIENSVSFGSSATDSTIDLSATLPIEKKINVNRGNVLQELMNAFKNENMDPYVDVINIDMVMPNGEVEIAEDNGGVFRDCLSQFWCDFYSQCTVGNTFKVPYLRHDFGREEWMAIAKIIVQGWRQVKYFPIRICPVIMEIALYGGIRSNLMDAFFQVISKSEAETLKTAMNDFQTVDTSELLEVMDIHQCRKIVSADNIGLILSEIAHKELVQEPKFVIDCFSEQLRRLDIILEDVYHQMEPSSQKVLKILQPPEQISAKQETVLKFLKKFIRDTSMLEHFLRFCTGSDVLSVDKIIISFTELSGLQRRPVAHTCGCVLEISTEYENYPQFKSEFEAILGSDIWVMDIV